MSFEAWVYVWNESLCDVTAPWTVQLAMVNAHDVQTGLIERSYQELADDCRGLSKATVIKAVRYLVEIGEVEVIEPGRAGRGNKRTYCFPRMMRPLTPAQREAQRRGEKVERQPYLRPNTVSDQIQPDPGKVESQPFRSEATDGKGQQKVTKRLRDNLSPIRGLPSPSPSVTGSTSLHREFESGPQARDQSRRKGSKPRRGSPVRRPDDPVVRQRVSEIRAAEGSRRADAYLRAVEESWNRKRAADALTEELAQGIGDVPS